MERGGESAARAVDTIALYIIRGTTTMSIQYNKTYTHAARVHKKFEIGGQMLDSACNTAHHVYIDINLLDRIRIFFESLLM